MKNLAKVLRPKGTKQFPLIKWFVFTGEPINPWRCETCITNRQNKKLTKENKPPADPQNFNPQPRICRKCGCDFF